MLQLLSPLTHTILSLSPLAPPRDLKSTLVLLNGATSLPSTVQPSARSSRSRLSLCIVGMSERRYYTDSIPLGRTIIPSLGATRGRAKLHADAALGVGAVVEEEEEEEEEEGRWMMTLVAMRWMRWQP